MPSTDRLYNPTRYSDCTWARTTGWQWSPPIVFVGVVLPIGWVNENVAASSWIRLFSVAIILAVGMSWSHLRRGRAATPS
ncbi:MAG TPA: hypothetical protein VFR53_10120 [Methylomirabilota bacterium]|nr:hypothetical protein [Methylomirabilota bacterium]